jgi:hypothetical protein
VSNPKAHRVDRVFAGGRIAGGVDTGALFSYACMLGGPTGRTLFVLTNSGSGPSMATKTDGRIEIIDVEVGAAGLP